MDENYPLNECPPAGAYFNISLMSEERFRIQFIMRVWQECGGATPSIPRFLYMVISLLSILYSGYAFDGSLLKSDAKLANEFRSHKQFMTSYMRGWDLMTRGQGLTDEKG